MCTVGGSGWWPSTWVPATNMKDPKGVAGPSFCGHQGVNQQMEGLHLCLSVLLFQINENLKNVWLCCNFQSVEWSLEAALLSLSSMWVLYLEVRFLDIDIKNKHFKVGTKCFDFFRILKQSPKTYPRHSLRHELPLVPSEAEQVKMFC